ncbi:hypothetical protein CGRAC_0067 [Campylobacter gracilis]|nr:hypothetical protein CGRAC_0067 [Campylobacter gracilis]
MILRVTKRIMKSKYKFTYRKLIIEYSSRELNKIANFALLQLEGDATDRITGFSNCPIVYKFKGRKML